MKRVWLWRVMSITTLLSAGVFMMAGSLHAQETLSSRISKKSATNEKSPMLVDAATLTYDDKNDIIIATGDVQIHQNNRLLQADRVRYDRKNDRVFATGNVRIRDEQGNITHAQQLEITDDFKDGFINGVLLVTPQKTRFAAARGERSAGNVTVFDRGTYTACEPCKDDPSKAPLWQLRANRVTHKEDEQTLYYQDSVLEFLGQPIAYIPYISSPDPTVKRKTGFLAPRYLATSELGVGVEVPFFWAVAPNMDLTLTPTVLTRQGAFMRADWRHRMITGAYDIKLSGIFQQEPGAFPPPPQGAGTRDFRGSVQTRGEFYLNDRWTWGWNLNALTDKYYFDDYSIAAKKTNELVSSLYLTGIGDRNYFDMRGMYFMGLTRFDKQKYMPFVHPVMDYNFRIKNAPLGGDAWIKTNITSLTREHSEFVGFNPFVAGYAVTDGSCAVYSKGRCVILGSSGTHSRASTEVSWRRTWTDSLGQVFTPQFNVRADGIWNQLDLGGGLNSNLTSFTTSDSQNFMRFMPTAAFTYRYPFVAQAFNATHILEPIAQIVVRPTETRSRLIFNEDSQSLIFDDTNLFALNRFGGWDRNEGGTRATAGLQYTVQTQSGQWISALVGQSYHIAGRNSFINTDFTNTGLSSGLDQSRSDIVTRLYWQPVQRWGFATRSRYDENSMALKQFEASATGTFDRITTQIVYSRYADQPLVGQPKREGIYAGGSYKLNDRWSVGAATRYVFTSQQFDYTALNLVYKDECTTASLDYVVDFTGTSNKDPVHKFFLRLNLRTLGDAGASASFGPPTP